MATKKIKKATKAKATRKKPAKAETDTPATIVVEGSAAAGPVEAATAGPPPKPRGRRKAARRDEPRIVSVAPGQPASTNGDVHVFRTSDAQIEKTGEAIVIQFPPVAPPPFPARLAPKPGAPVSEQSAGTNPPAAAGPAVAKAPARPQPERRADRDRGFRADRESRDERDVVDRRDARGDRIEPPRRTNGDDASPGVVDEAGPPGERRRRRRRRGRGGGRRDDQQGPPQDQPTAPMEIESPRRDEAAADEEEDIEGRAAFEEEDGGLDRGESGSAPVRADAEEGETSRRRRRRRRRRRGRGEPIETRGPSSEIDAAGEAEELFESARDDVEDFAEIAEVDEVGVDEGVDNEVEEGETEVEDRPRRGRSYRDQRRRRHWDDREVIEVSDEYSPDDVEAPPLEKVMLINVAPREECRIAILENSRLEEIYIERASSENYVGNIYKGVVTNVEPSIQAAFVDFGIGKNGFLHISDLHPMYFKGGEGQIENVGRKMPRRHRPPIQNALRRGQEVVVQITKEGIGTKGPTLTTYLSIPGRFLVMMPGMAKLGVSRKIEDDAIRLKLRRQLGELKLMNEMGFIARTAAQNRTTEELQSDLNYLTRLWKAVEKRRKNDRAPCELYRESDLVIRTIRDVFTSDVKEIVVDDADVADRAMEFLSIFSPKSADIVKKYDSREPIFHKYGIEAELERLHTRHVPLRSGGSLVIDQTEALVAIDVNSGRFRAEDDAETTAFKINLEAADEIPRQLRLRDLGGVVICDFIDMRFERHRQAIEQRLVRNLKVHKERAKILRMSAFGIIEMTRQRQRASLTRSVYRECYHCRGSGLVKTPESVALDVMRLIQFAATKEHIASIEVSVGLDVAFLLQNRKRGLLHELETRHRRTILLRPDPTFGQDQVEIRCTDVRGRIVPHM